MIKVPEGKTKVMVSSPFNIYESWAGYIDGYVYNSVKHISYAMVVDVRRGHIFQVSTEFLKVEGS